MLSKEHKMKLVLMFKNGIINKEQLKTILNFGYPFPILLEPYTKLINYQNHTPKLCGFRR